MASGRWGWWRWHRPFEPRFPRERSHPHLGLEAPPSRRDPASQALRPLAQTRLPAGRRGHRSARGVRPSRRVTPPPAGGGSPAPGMGRSLPRRPATGLWPRARPRWAAALLSRPGSRGPAPEAGSPSSGSVQQAWAAPGAIAEAPGSRPEGSAPEGPAAASPSPSEAPADSQPPSSSSSRLSSRPPSASSAAEGPLLRQAALGGMAAGTLLEAGLARVLFYPTLLYTMVRGQVPGPARRDWYNRIDRTVLLGALPLRRMTRRLVEDENVRGVITMNEEYETRFLCNSAKEWRKIGVEQLRLSTIDMTGIPTLTNLERGVQFALKYQSLGQSVYVHCKAGRSRSATMVAAYLIQVYNWTPEEAIRAIAKIRSHIYIRPGQFDILEEFHRKVTAEAAKKELYYT